jgi:hypothetical protein
MIGWLLATLLCLPGIVLADWSDDFDSYIAGTDIVGQGGWEQWGPGSGAFVSNLYSLSPENSLEIADTSDVVHQYSGYTSGKWFYIARMYIPSDYSGVEPQYFIMLNTYTYPSGPYEWSVQVGFDSSDGNIHCDCGDNTEVVGPPYVVDDWAEIRVYIDLDEDWTQIYYEGILLDDPDVEDHPLLGGGYQWTAGVFGNDTGALDIAAVDLFAYGGTPVYYDDMSLAPIEPWVDVKVNDSDSNVQIAPGENVKITYAVVGGLEISGDVWHIMQTPFPGQFRYATYDGEGPIEGWWIGLGGGPLASGLLGNYAGTSLNRPLPVGSWRVFLFIDGIANGRPGLPILALDYVDFYIGGE